MIVLLLVGLGLVLGSFINALVWRLHEGKDWVKDRSECPSCHHKLAARDLVPVVSWLLLGGKCRYCHKPIPDSPIVELVVPVLFVTSFYFWSQPISGVSLFTFILWLVFLVGFVALAVYDLKWFLLPDVIVFPLIGLAIFQVLGSWLFFHGTFTNVLGGLLGDSIISGLFYLIFEVSKCKWIGFGDVKLGIVLGLLAGGALQAFLLLFAASLLGVLVSLPLVLSGKADRKSHIPFGPLLILGMIVVQLFGQSLLNWYTGAIIGT
jgi:leader peptidase (prepilin peptidase)/N-methyltransferase